jgi:hypothetical protein
LKRMYSRPPHDGAGAARAFTHVRRELDEPEAGIQIAAGLCLRVTRVPFSAASQISHP